MKRSRMFAIGAVLMFAGLWATGALEKLLTGDTLSYLKYFGGIVSLGIGGYLLKHGVWDSDN